MPSKQRGSVVKRGASWSARWYDEKGVRRSHGGFETKTAAGEWLDTKVDEVLRTSARRPSSSRHIPTVTELVDGYLASHEVDPATTTKLRYAARARDPHVRRPSHRRATAARTVDVAGNAAGTVPAPAVRRVQGRARAGGHPRSVAGEPGRPDQEPAASRLDEDREIRPFTSWDEVEAIGDELTPHLPADPCRARRHRATAGGVVRARMA